MKVTSTKCIAECRKCIIKCQKCCELNKNKADMKECCKCCKCCIIICNAVCEMLKCDDCCDMTKRLCMLCVSCCKKCATQCAKFKDNKVCKDCSIACKTCETACKKCCNSKTNSITKKGGNGNNNATIATIPKNNYVQQMKSTVILVELYDIDVSVENLENRRYNGIMSTHHHNEFANKPKSYFIIGSNESFVNIFNTISEEIYRAPSQLYFTTSDTELGHKAYEGSIDRLFVSLEDVCKRLNNDTPGNGPRNMSYSAILNSIPKLMEYGIINGPSTFNGATSGKTIYDYIGVTQTNAIASNNVYTLRVYIADGMLIHKLKLQAKNNKNNKNRTN